MKMRPIAFIGFYFMILFSAPSHGQSGGLATQIEILREKAHAMQEGEHYAEALKEYLEAERLAEIQRKHSQTGLLLSEISSLYEVWKVYPKMNEYARKWLELSEAHNLPLDLPLQKTALSYMLMRKDAQAIAAYQRAALWSEKHGKAKKAAAVYGQMSFLQQKNGDIPSSKISALKSAEIYQSLNDTLPFCAALNNLGYLERLGGDLKKSSAYMDAADAHISAYLSIAGRNVSGKENAYLATNQGVVQANLGNFNSAIDYFQTAVNIWNREKNFGEMAETQIYIAKALIKTGKPDRAAQALNACIAIAKKVENDQTVLSALQMLAEAYEADGDFQKASKARGEYAALHDTIAHREADEQQGRLENQLEAERNESGFRLLFAEKQKQDLQLEQFKLQREANERDIAYNMQQIELLKKEQALGKAAEGQKRLEEERAMQELYISRKKLEEEIKQSEIASLQRDNEIQNLAIEKQQLLSSEKEKEIAFLEKEKQAHHAQRESDKIIRWFTIGFSVLALITVLFVLYSFFKQSKLNKKLKLQRIEIENSNKELIANEEELKANEEELHQNMEELQATQSRLVQQHNLLEKKNNDITSSILYAERIQKAILKPEQDLLALVPDACIFFIPRDILSGDFFWFKQLDEGLSVVSVADCTGHGVPGAIMTMIGSSVLHDVYNANEAVMPDAALRALDKKLYDMFGKEKNTSVNDGMDIALALIDHKNMKLYYAGAKSPIYRVSEGLIEKIKPSKFPIGGSLKEDKVFDLHTFEIKKGDKYYMVSDGFQDQFDATDKKKFTSKKLQELILTVSPLPMARQKEAFAKAFSEWKGQNRQIDDVLLLAFEV